MWHLPFSSFAVVRGVYRERRFACKKYLKYGMCLPIGVRSVTVACFTVKYNVAILFSIFPVLPVARVLSSMTKARLQWQNFVGPTQPTMLTAAGLLYML